MFKKIAAMAGSAALIATMATPAFAGGSGMWGNFHFGSSFTNSSTANVTTSTSAISDTGGNTQTGTASNCGCNQLSFWHHNSNNNNVFSTNNLTTGSADSTAGSNVTLGVNQTVMPTIHSFGGVILKNTSMANVTTTTNAGSNTGNNTQTSTALGAGATSTNNMTTGSASSTSNSVVNVQITQ